MIWPFLKSWKFITWLLWLNMEHWYQKLFFFKLFNKNCSVKSKPLYPQVYLLVTNIYKYAIHVHKSVKNIDVRVSDFCYVICFPCMIFLKNLIKRLKPQKKKKCVPAISVHKACITGFIQGDLALTQTRN